MSTQALKINFDETHGQLWLSALTASLLILGMAYIYLINTSVFLVNARQNAAETSAQIGASLAVSETDYLQRQTAIDLSAAMVLGFVEASKNSSFVYRSKPPAGETALSLSR